eukprot:UN06761
MEDRSSVDEGIVDKLQLMTDHNMRQNSKSSMNLTVDMSTGHIITSVEEHPDVQFEQKRYRKRIHKNHFRNQNEDETKKSVCECKNEVSFGVDCKNDDAEHVELEPDEFIVHGESFENTKGILVNVSAPYYDRKITDFNEHKDADGYYVDYVDSDDEINIGIGNKTKEGLHTNHGNDSDEEFYEEPEFNRKETDGFIGDDNENESLVLGSDEFIALPRIKSISIHV